LEELGRRSRMNTGRSPYPEFLIDEASGIQVPNVRHKAWAEGYEAGRKDRQVINRVLKAQNGMVLVFDNKGEQIPEYQGQYNKIKPRILEDAPPGTVFSHALDGKAELRIVSREEW